MRRVVVILAALIAVAGLGAFGVARLSSVHVPFLTDTCRVYAADKVVRIEPDQLTHAATIAAVAVRRQLPERAVTIALATAFQESKLRNLSSGDRDSVGLFQQRPSQGWGTPEQLQDPRYAAGKFYTHLLKVPNWQTQRLTDAAQAVQRSGHPTLYQKWEGDAHAIAVAFLGTEPGAVTCQLREKNEEGGAESAKGIVAELGQDLGKLSVTSQAVRRRPDRQGGRRRRRELHARLADRALVRGEVPRLRHRAGRPRRQGVDGRQREVEGRRQGHQEPRRDHDRQEGLSPAADRTQDAPCRQPSAVTGRTGVASHFSTRPRMSDG